MGRITDLQFDPNDPQSVIVTLQVQPNLNIREDSVASIESQGLTGGTYVEISGGTAKSPLLVAKAGQQYPVIRTKQSGSAAIGAIRAGSGGQAQCRGLAPQRSAQRQ